MRYMGCMGERLSLYQIQQLKDNIEKLEKNHQVEILRILYTNRATLNENKNGVLVNLTETSDDIISKLVDYVEYVNTQEKMLEIVESEKESYRILLDSKSQSDNA